MRTLFTLLLMSLMVSSWAFDFKGVAIGSAATPAQIQERLGVKCGKGHEGSHVCNGNVTVAREPASMNLVIGSKGIVERIALTLSPEAFDEVSPELIRKFGNPTSTSRSVIQNRMGAKYSQVIHLWKAKDGTEVFYMKYVGSLDISAINFSTEADRALLGKNKKNRDGDL
jgi:hypothetical protein